MGIQYFDGRSWSEITREERYFCAELYFEVRGREKAFVAWLNRKTHLRLTPHQLAAEWECGFEVCFYRDFKYEFQRKSHAWKGYSPKRTFDLCLFSNEVLIIIEAKAFQGFLRKQIAEFEHDRRAVPAAIQRGRHNSPLIVRIVALAASNYISRTLVKSDFDGLISWAQMYSLFKNQAFTRADSLYRLKQ